MGGHQGHVYDLRPGVRGRLEQSCLKARCTTLLLVEQALVRETLTVQARRALKTVQARGKLAVASYSKC